MAMIIMATATGMGTGTGTSRASAGTKKRAFGQALRAVQDPAHSLEQAKKNVTNQAFAAVVDKDSQLL